MDVKTLARPKVIIPVVLVIVIIIVVALVAVFFLRNPSAADDLLSTMNPTTEMPTEDHTSGPGIQSPTADSSSVTRTFASAVTSPAHHEENGGRKINSAGTAPPSEFTASPSSSIQKLEPLQLSPGDPAETTRKRRFA